MKKLRLNRFISLTLLYVFTVDLRISGSQTVNESDDIRRCPEGYFLHTDELCYPKVRKPCPFETQIPATATATATAIAPQTATTAQSSINFKAFECPDGSILFQDKCRKIICTFGEYYRSTCLQPVCPQGLVWRGKMCQKPAYLTTILQIDNVIFNEVVEKAIAVAAVNETASQRSTKIRKPAHTSRSLPLIKTTQKPDYTSTTTTIKFNVTNQQSSGSCCKVLTPRLCKLYGDKWLCFNRKYGRCDSHVCTAPVVYLTPPEIAFEPPLLVMPPNPKLNLCEGNSCQNNSDVVDCSGCSSFLYETCSSSCYRYICPKKSCVFMDLYEYCSNYPGKDGCLPRDGCLWKWCQA